jgi:hypothetical protein
MNNHCCYKYTYTTHWNIFMLFNLLFNYQKVHIFNASKLKKIKLVGTQKYLDNEFETLSNYVYNLTKTFKKM